MIRDALQYLNERFVAAKGLTPLSGIDPREATYLAPDGTFFGIAKRPRPRDHDPRSLDATIDLANRFAAEDGFTPAVWYSETAVTVVLDDGGHRIETAKLDLAFSDAFNEAALLRTASAKSHRDFVRFLRIKFAGIQEAEDLAKKVETVRFEDNQVQTGQVLRSRESMGAEISSKVTAGGKNSPVPSEVTLKIPVYKVYGLREARPVSFVLDVDPEAKTFRLVPFPDEIESVLHEAVESLAVAIAAGLNDGIPCYYGNP